MHSTYQCQSANVDIYTSVIKSQNVVYEKNVSQLKNEKNKKFNSKRFQPKDRGKLK